MTTESTPDASGAATARRAAVRLEHATVAWNVGEVFVTVGLGIAAGSLALVAFGLDSLIEIFASVVVLWQLRDGGDVRTSRAMALVALAFLALGLFLSATSVQALVARNHPDSSPFGILYMAIAAIAMYWLAWRKRRIGARLGSHPLATEARMTLLDGVLASTVLCALLANAAFGAWWADALAAFVVALAALREAVDAWRDSRDPSRME